MSRPLNKLGARMVQPLSSSKYTDGGRLWLVNPATHSDYMLATRLAPLIGL